jgi:glycosyltransferase involved in cell wall biosynthesis
MKILYLSVYRDGTGWAEAANRYILALDAAGVEVVPRPIRLEAVSHTPSDRVLELEKRSSKGCNVVIQHTLPYMMDYNGRFDLNVGLYFSETDSILHSSWADRLSNMDLVLGCNRQMEVAARDSYLFKPYRIIPIPADVNIYRREWSPLDKVKQLKDEGNFVFYTVGEMIRRKNLQGLLKAFHTEFAPEEPVSLVIKTSRQGMTAQETRQKMNEFCVRIKNGLKLYGGGSAEHYKQEVILTERLSADDLFRLHAACDCFVQPSYGEAWSIPDFDAMAMGKTPIVTDWGGYPDYVNNDCGWLVPAYREQVFGIEESFADMYTGKESWAAVDPIVLRRAMREAYESKGLKQQKAEAGIRRAADFSYEAVGKTMKEVLEHELERSNKGHKLAGSKG